MILAGQSIADLEVALRSHSDARRALANVGSFVTLRAANPEDAKYFSDKCGMRPLRHVSSGESYEPALFSSSRTNIDDFAYRSSRQVGVRNESLVAGLLLRERLRVGSSYASPSVSFLAKRLSEGVLLVFLVWSLSPVPLPYGGFYPLLAGLAMGTTTYVANLPLRL